MEAYQKGGIYLNARERILVIRLMEKLERQAKYAKALGLEASGAGREQKTDEKGLTNV